MGLAGFHVSRKIPNAWVWAWRSTYLIYELSKLTAFISCVITRINFQVLGGSVYDSIHTGDTALLLIWDDFGYHIMCIL